MSGEAIQFAQADQFVSEACRLIGKRDSKPFPLRIFFFIFEVLSLPAPIYVWYERESIRPYIPNPMRCYRCQKFGHTQQRCASNLVCGHCGENGHSEDPCPNPPHCENCSGAHASADRRCPAFLDERAIQELRAKGGLSFLDARKKFLENKPKTGTQSYESALRRPQGTDAATQTTALPSRGSTSLLPPTIISTQSEVSTETEDLPTPTVPAVKIRACQPSAQERRQPRIFVRSPRPKKHAGPGLVQVHGKSRAMRSPYPQRAPLRYI
jgi:hypothetical protein